MARGLGLEFYKSKAGGTFAIYNPRSGEVWFYQITGHKRLKIKSVCRFGYAGTRLILKMTSIVDPSYFTLWTKLEFEDQIL